MAHYRLYILGTPPRLLGMARSIDKAESLCAGTDEESILAGWAIYWQHEWSHGFEIWEGTRLVFRHCARNADRRAAAVARFAQASAQSMS